MGFYLWPLVGNPTTFLWCDWWSVLPPNFHLSLQMNYTGPLAGLFSVLQQDCVMKLSYDKRGFWKGSRDKSLSRDEYCIEGCL